MARERMVTRTVNEVTANIMIVDTDTACVETILFKIGGGITGEKAILKTVNGTLKNTTKKAVSVIKTETQQVLYGMREVDFIKYAEILPPRTTANAEE